MILFLSFVLFPSIFEQLSQRRLLESGRSLERGVEFKLNVVCLRGGVYGKRRFPRGGVITSFTVLRMESHQPWEEE